MHNNTEMFIMLDVTVFMSGHSQHAYQHQQHRHHHQNTTPHIKIKHTQSDLPPDDSMGKTKQTLKKDHKYNTTTSDRNISLQTNIPE